MIQFYLAHLYAYPGDKMMQTDVAKWVCEQWMNRHMCWWAHWGAFLFAFLILPFLLKPNALTWKLCITLGHDVHPTLSVAERLFTFLRPLPSAL